MSINNSQQIEFVVKGDYALFTDPITRIGGEKWSYQIPTYEALKGILASVYWKPTFIWYIDAVRVMNPIQTEVKGIRPIIYDSATEKNTLAYYTYLKDVEYRVKAHFEWNKNRPELVSDRSFVKHKSITNRMIEKGGRRDVFLGTRECQAYVTPGKFEDGAGFYDNISHLSFGPMVHGITYPDEAYDDFTKGHITQNIWSPVMNNGIIEFIRPEKCKHNRLHECEMKKFGRRYADNAM